MSTTERALCFLFGGLVALLMFLYKQEARITSLERHVAVCSAKVGAQ